jgi:hypothetical protein
MADTVSASDLLGYAEAQLGKPYVFGAAGPSTFDCSGLVSYVFSNFGISLPHHAADQATYGSSVATGDIQAGDLVFSDWGDGSNSHVGIAVSPTEIIDAPHTGADVRYDNLTSGYLSHVTAVRRLEQVTGSTSVAGAVAAAAVDPLLLIADAIKTAAAPLGEVGKTADWIMKLAMPSNFIRIVCMIAGFVFVGWGVILLAREVRK